MPQHVPGGCSGIDLRALGYLVQAMPELELKLITAEQLFAPVAAERHVAVARKLRSGIGNMIGWDALGHGTLMQMPDCGAGEGAAPWARGKFDPEWHHEPSASCARMLFPLAEMFALPEGGGLLCRKCRLTFADPTGQPQP
jgi:hypothetical protein